MESISSILCSHEWLLPSLFSSFPCSPSLLSRKSVRILPQSCRVPAVVTKERMLWDQEARWASCQLAVLFALCVDFHTPLLCSPKMPMTRGPTSSSSRAFIPSPSLSVWHGICLALPHDFTAGCLQLNAVTVDFLNNHGRRGIKIPRCMQPR